MAKINLNILPKKEALVILRHYQKNKYKQGTGMGRFSGQDPFVNESCIIKKFTVSLELAAELIEILRIADNKYASYVEHFISNEIKLKFKKEDGNNS